MHEKDRALLELIQAFFGVGKIYKHGKHSIHYRVSSTEDLKVIIDHFDKYPLISQKLADYLLFKQIVEILSRKEHLTNEGLVQIVNIRASMNNGLSDSQQAAFPNTIPILRPLVTGNTQKIKDPYWLSGFVSGDGCFSISIYKSSQKSGSQVTLDFRVTQHIRDIELLKNFMSTLGCGRLRVRSNGFACDFVVTRFSDNIEKIIPFFGKYKIEGAKYLDYADFCKGMSLMKTAAHLTIEGLEQIRKIKEGMNSRRL